MSTEINEINTSKLIKQSQSLQSRGITALKAFNRFSFLAIKRGFDVFCGIVGIVCLIPITIVLKLITLISGDTKSIFYTQKRIGKDGKEIHLYKFRSMVPNADEILQDLLDNNPDLAKEWKENQKLKDDPRITKIGKIIRKTSIDEMPQFINVFRGDMSLIGPRPLVSGELEAHDGNHAKYEAMRPGITGWWACNGRNALNYTDRLNLEYYYVDNASLLLDLKCIFKTIEAVVKKTGVE